jgi:hypothetical protein
MTLTNLETIKHSENAKYGGLSNVLHPINISGETKINKFKFDLENNKVIIYDSENIMTHVQGIDFNSLYPSGSASIKNDMIKYTDNVMHMPGRFKRRMNINSQEGRCRFSC